MIRRRFGIRSQLLEPVVSDTRLPYSFNSLSIVLRDWKVIGESYDLVAEKIFTKYVNDYPTSGKLFDRQEGVYGEGSKEKEDRVDHACFIMNILNAAIRSLSGEYEDDGEFLSLIGRSHKKRGITLAMFNDLKDSILSVFSSHLRSNKKARLAWAEIISYIFDNYLCIAYYPNK